jgi:integrase/recombinase XerD
MNTDEHRYPELEAFLDHLRMERGLSLNTCVSYRRDLLDFLGYLSTQDKMATAATLLDGKQYAGSLRRRGLKSSSAARRISALRSFYNYLTFAAIISENPMALLSGPKIVRPLPRILSVEDVSRLIESPDTSCEGGLRDRAMMEILYASGLRVSEAAGMEFGDLDLGEGWVLIRGKGSKERWAPMGESAAHWINRYLKEARPLLCKRNHSCRTVFLNARGKPLTRQGIWHVIKGYASSLSPPLLVHPHTLRHCCATHLLEGGADLRTVQEFLGHADISTTQIYTHTDRSYLREIHRSFHPRG